MSRLLIFRMLRQLGGTATTKQIRDAARKMYPHKTLWRYVSNRLKVLEEQGFISSEKKPKRRRIWTIKRDFEKHGSGRML